MTTDLQTIQNIFPNLPMMELESVSQGIMPVLTLRQIRFYMLCNGHGFDTVQETNEIFEVCRKKALAIRDCDIPGSDRSFIIRSPIEDDGITVDDEMIANPEKKSGRGRHIDPNSKMQRSFALYADANDKSIHAILPLYMDKLGLKEATARVYYHKAKKEYNNATFA
jgi:hypothetical protein